jgi:hypothetical protein
MIIVASHELFYMENACDYKPSDPGVPSSKTAEEHQPSCFALEEERGAVWKGGGAMGPAINEARPNL